MAKLAVPGVVLLIATLSYTSQYLFYVIEPGPLDSRQAKIFNLLVICIWISYARACTIGPGSVPKGWSPDANTKKQTSSDENENEKYRARQRYCRKCNALKPPRSHHCKVCKRYVSQENPGTSETDQTIKVYTQNGPSLPLDLQLCISFHFSSFHAVSVVRRFCHGVPRILPLP